MKKIIILLGVPGSGKGTQAKMLASEFGYAHISTGDLFRALAANPDAPAEQKTMLEEMKAGKLVADKLVYELAFVEIERNLTTGKGVVLDGAIRNVNQAEKFQEFFLHKDLGLEVVVVLIELTDEQSFERLSKRKICQSCGHIIPYSPDNVDKISCGECGGILTVRADDNPTVINKRIEDQGNMAIAPIVAYYRAHNLLKSVSGENTIAGVQAEIIQCVQ